MDRGSRGRAAAGAEARGQKRQQQRGIAADGQKPSMQRQMDVDGQKGRQPQQWRQGYSSRARITKTAAITQREWRYAGGCTTKE